MLRLLCANQGAIAPLRIEYDTSSRAKEQVHDRVTTCRARVRDRMFYSDFNTVCLLCLSCCLLLV